VEEYQADVRRGCAVREGWQQPS